MKILQLDEQTQIDFDLFDNFKDLTNEEYNPLFAKHKRVILKYILEDKSLFKKYISEETFYYLAKELKNSPALVTLAQNFIYHADTIWEFRTIADIQQFNSILADKLLWFILADKEKFAAYINNAEKLNAYLTLFPGQAIKIIKNIDKDYLQKNVENVKALYQFRRVMPDDVFQQLIIFIFNDNDLFKKYVMDTTSFILLIELANRDQKVVGISSLLFDATLFSKVVSNMCIEEVALFLTGNENLAHDIPIITQGNEYNPANEFLFNYLTMHIEKVKDGKFLKDLDTLGLEDSRPQFLTELLLRALQMLNAQAKQNQNLRLSLALEDIIKFLNNPANTWFPNLSRNGVAIELLQHIYVPYLIDQGHKNLCGPSSFITALAQNAPEQYVKIVCNLVATGATHEPFSIKSKESFHPQHFSVAELVNFALRDTSNLLGYNPHLFEKESAATRPKRICEWFKNCGFTNVTDTTVVTGSDAKELSLLYRGILGGVYDTKHQTFSSVLENVNFMIGRIQQGDCVIGFLSPKMLAPIINPGAAPMSTNPTVFLGIECSHYVNIRELQHDPAADTVAITFWTYGKEYKHNFTTQEFLDGYRGGIIATPPIAPQLQQQPQNKTAA